MCQLIVFEAPRVKAKPVRYGDDAWFRAFFAVAPFKVGAIVMFLTGTGARISEVMRLAEGDLAAAVAAELAQLAQVVDVGAPPAIDRLVVVTHRKDVAAGLHKGAQQLILHRVGILVFVDQDVFEALLVLLQNLAVGLQDLEHVEQQIAEIDRVQRFQPLLIERVELAALAHHFDLARDLGVDRELDEAERVHVLDLGARAEGAAALPAGPRGAQARRCLRPRRRGGSPGWSRSTAEAPPLRIFFVPPDRPARVESFWNP